MLGGIPRVYVGIPPIFYKKRERINETHSLFILVSKY